MDLCRALCPSDIILGYGDRMAANDFQLTPTKPGFSLAGGVKDASLIKKMADDSGVALPFVDVARGHLMKRVEAGDDDLDWACLARSVREESGMLK
ncbi:hypothetical protein HDU76_000494 [Blyttiomyces sp. JEL0837]|nr:hypothetical protein HDU76_000494 [Blyttiomyces sp. JEL0837]